MPELIYDRDVLLMTTLEAAVPPLIAQLRTEPFEVRQRIGAEAGSVLAHQGDTLMFGSKHTKFGSGARELRKHASHVRPVTREVYDRCDVCRKGHPDYSAGEVFNFLASALAVGACQPGGVTFAGSHWCAFRHPWCANAKGTPAPGCCTCDADCLVAAGTDGECHSSCPWCRNGCSEKCDHPAPPAEWQQSAPRPLPPIPMGFRPDKEYGDPIQ